MTDPIRFCLLTPDLLSSIVSSLVETRTRIPILHYVEEIREIIFDENINMPTSTSMIDHLASIYEKHEINDINIRIERLKYLIGVLYNNPQDITHKKANDDQEAKVLDIDKIKTEVEIKLMPCSVPIHHPTHNIYSYVSKTNSLTEGDIEKLAGVKNILSSFFPLASTCKTIRQLVFSHPSMSTIWNNICLYITGISNRSPKIMSDSRCRLAYERFQAVYLSANYYKNSEYFAPYNIAVDSRQAVAKTRVDLVLNEYQNSKEKIKQLIYSLPLNKKITKVMTYLYMPFVFNSLIINPKWINIQVDKRQAPIISLKYVELMMSIIDNNIGIMQPKNYNWMYLLYNHLNGKLIPDDYYDIEKTFFKNHICPTKILLSDMLNLYHNNVDTFTKVLNEFKTLKKTQQNVLQKYSNIESTDTRTHPFWNAHGIIFTNKTINNEILTQKSVLQKLKTKIGFLDIFNAQFYNASPYETKTQKRVDKNENKNKNTIIGVKRGLSSIMTKFISNSEENDDDDDDDDDDDQEDGTGIIHDSIILERNSYKDSVNDKHRTIHKNRNKGNVHVHKRRKLI